MLGELPAGLRHGVLAGNWTSAEVAKAPRADRRSKHQDDNQDQSPFNRHQGRILLKNSLLIDRPSADSIPLGDRRIGNDGTAARGATGTVL